MFRSMVCDAGGVLILAGALDGEVPQHSEYLALDWSSVTVGRFLAMRYEGQSEAFQVEFGLALSVVHEWFPVRSIMGQCMARAGHASADTLDSWSALVLAERLELPLFSVSEDVTSNNIEILRPW